MKDAYPPYPTVPAACLVPAEHQPEYLPLTGHDLPDTANLAEAIVGAAPARSTAIIHHESGRSVTFGELGASSARLANGLLALGVKPGERVAFRSPNRPEVVILALAAWRIGAVIVPIPLQARPDEVRFYLDDTGARALFTDAPERDRTAATGTSVEHLIAFADWPDEPRAPARPAVPCDSLAIIWHTGGTTGQPKPCYHTHRRFLLAGYACGEATATTRGRRWLAAAPMGHGLGFICNTIYTLLHGAAVVMVDDFQRAGNLLDALQEHHVDTLMAITVTWERLLDELEHGLAGRDLSSLTTGYAMWQSASASDVRDRWRARGIELLNNFGSTSFATWVLVPRPRETLAPASLGRPGPGYRVLAVDPDAAGIEPVAAGMPGRMAVRGPTGLTYWNRPQLQARDVVEGWTLQDDLIRFDDAGAADYLGRSDYMISTAGYKVAPAEVEDALSRHPAVREVAVIGLPDALRQEIVAAFVAVKDGVTQSDLLRRELQQHVQRELSPYKYPRRVEFVACLPRDGVGKVRPSLLLEAVEGRSSPA